MLRSDVPLQQRVGVIQPGRNNTDYSFVASSVSTGLMCRRARMWKLRHRTTSVICRQGCRRYGDSHGDSHGYGYGMGMGTVMNPHGPVGIMWGFFIKRKCVKYAINVIFLMFEFHGIKSKFEFVL